MIPQPVFHNPVRQAKHAEFEARMQEFDVAWALERQIEVTIWKWMERDMRTVPELNQAIIEALRLLKTIFPNANPAGVFC